MKKRNSTLLIRELPAPPAGKTGWPWDIESRVVQSDSLPEDGLPKITIVTPSYNQGEFLEETIRSVLLQNYPNLEYIIIDGGSTDNSVEIIKKYEPWIDYWVSEPDRGQSHAINKGFGRATGQWGNWINSDDLLAKDALLNMAGVLQNAKPKTLFIGEFIHTNRDRSISKVSSTNIKNFEDLIDIPNYWRKSGGFQQNALYDIHCFKEISGLNEDNHFTMDYELWGELLLNNNQIRLLDFPIGIFRIYEGQKISDQLTTTKSLLKSARKLVRKNSSFTLGQRVFKLIKILNYEISYRYGLLRSVIGIKRRWKNIKRWS